MGEYTDKAKGKAKQVAGDLTDDDQLHAEGKSDEAVGEAKGAIDKVADALHDGIDWIKDRLK